eukprot:768796-Hanusia_phi.AAC.1
MLHIRSVGSGGLRWLIRGEQAGDDSTISSFLGRAEQTSAPKISCSNPDNRPCRLSMSLTRAWRRMSTGR